MTKKTTNPRVSAMLKEFGTSIKTVIAQEGKHATYEWLDNRARDQSGIRLPKASLSRLLNGVSEPDWSMVAQILRLCDVEKTEIAAVWHPKWKNLIERIRVVEMTEQIAPTQAIQECPICGSAVLNQARHDEFHANIDARLRRNGLRIAG